MTLFFERGVFFDMGEKVGYSVFRKHSSCNTNTVCKQKQKIDEKLWVVFEHGKRVFLFVFFRF